MSRWSLYNIDDKCMMINECGTGAEIEILKEN
jgi:hypothetical protein